jgi:hypothetical protein
MKFNIFSNPQPNDNPSSNNTDRVLELEIMRELLRQVRLTFNLALGVSAASALITLSGVGLLYFNKVPEASLTAGAGALASIGSVQFAKEAKDELQEMMTKSEK